MDNLNARAPGVTGALSWRCLLARADVPDLFRAVYRAAKLPGRDVLEAGRWRLFDENGHLLYEVADVHGTVSIDAPDVVHRLIGKALELFPEAFGVRGDIPAFLPATDTSKRVHRKCA